MHIKTDPINAGHIPFEDFLQSFKNGDFGTSVNVHFTLNNNRLFFEIEGNDVKPQALSLLASASQTKSSLPA